MAAISGDRGWSFAGGKSVERRFAVQLAVEFLTFLLAGPPKLQIDRLQLDHVRHALKMIWCLWESQASHLNTG